MSAVELLSAANAEQTYIKKSEAAEYFAGAFTTSEASGAVASFPDGADNIPMKSVIAHIEPVQAGSGDPSPTNVRAISGFSAANIRGTGKNLFSFGNVTKKKIYRANMKPIGNSLNDVYLSGASGASDNQRLSVSSWAYCILYLGIRPFDVDTSVTLSCNVVNYTADCAGFVSIGYTNANGDFVPSARYNFNDVGTFSMSITGTIPVGYAPVIRAAPACKGTEVVLTQYAELHNIQLEIGSTATAYEPYNGNTYPITFDSAGTVYGGYVDPINGQLVATHKGVDLGDLSWAYVSGNEYFRTKITDAEGPVANGLQDVICSCYKRFNGTGTSFFVSDKTCYAASTSINTTNKWLCIRDSDYTDVESFVAAVTGQTLVYPLATPITYQLSSTTITSLLGQNNIWADTGDIEVEYRADPALYIEDTYAKKIGEYPDLTAGTAEGLIGQSYEADQSAYIYRRSHEGGRVREQIVGGTVAWNQLVNKASIPTSTNRGITFTNNDDGTWTLNGTADAQAVSAEAEVSNAVNHVFYFSGSYMQMREGGASFMIVSDSPRIGKNVSTPVTVRFRVSSNITLTNLVVTPQIIDLTAMFGSTIADYVYSLEQTTAGAGVAWLKQYIDLDTYHAYNAGSLESVQTEGREVVGFNLFDKDDPNMLSSTYLKADGSMYDGTTHYDSFVSDYIRVFPNTDYFFAKQFGANYERYNCWYDKDKNFISSNKSSYAVSGAVVTSPTNARYLRVTVGINFLETLVVNLSDPAKNGTYEPYEKLIYPVSNIVLRGIPKLVDNQLAFDGDVYAADGTVTRRYAEYTFTGDESWTYETGDVFRTTLNLGAYKYTAVNNYVIYGIMSNGFEEYGRAGANQPDKTFVYNSLAHTANRLYIKDSAYTAETIADFKAAMTGVKIIFLLATPTTETADPYAPVQEVGSVERWIDDRAVPVPVGQNSKYYPDYAEKIDGLPSDFSTLIAPTEASYVATRNYAVGDYFIVDNVLYCASAAISTGTAITPDSNCRAVTIMEIIKEILDAL